MKKIYGNSELIKDLAIMSEKDRMAHTVLFYGEKGSGRKLMAQYYTQLLLCESPENGRPCGKCRTCENIENGFHPDVIFAKTAGKLEGYSVSEARAVCADAFVMPNNESGRKVYIFRDCHNMDPRTQNTLLKIIEEPPEYAYFIFTSESRSDFLQTVISRCVCFGVSVCTDEESAKALADEGFNADEIKTAVECFHGNIGMCIDYLRDGKMRESVDLTKRLADSIIERDEYNMNKEANSVGTQRNDVRNMLMMLDRIIRDAAVLIGDKDARLTGCYGDGARRLAETVTADGAVRIHEQIEKAWSAVESNVNIPLVLSALCGEIAGILRM